MLLGVRSTKLWSIQLSFSTISHRFKRRASSSIESKVLQNKDDDDDFLPWLERKAGVEISSVLSIGKSAYGRSLFASKNIKTGDCILRIPYNVQITSNNLLPELKSLVGDKVGNVAKLAIVLLFEKKMDWDSEWAPYISRLPQLGEMHNTIFWAEDELDQIRQSSLYQETINKRVQIEKEYLAIQKALEDFPEVMDKTAFEDFMHAYTLVESRAWRSLKGVSLIPFADFLNHDGFSEAIVLNDEDKQLSEVIADRDYDPCEEVQIRYGKFSNATLLLEFGFTLPYNNYDKVNIQISMPHDDPLRMTKLELLQRHCLPKIKNVHDLDAPTNNFLIKEVKSVTGKGKGLPQSLRAFARVLSCTSTQELCDLAVEAAQNDGRLARRPLKNSIQEILAHDILLSHISQISEEYNASLESLKAVDSPLVPETYALRKQMARDLLMGELRILNSASAWLNNYCATLT